MRRAALIEDSAALGVWRYERASRAHVVIDAAAYFNVVREAMLNARCRIMLIGWDFDTRIHLKKGRRRRGDPPSRLGDFIVWLADRNPDLEIRIIKWNFGALKMLGRGSTLLDIARWAMHPQIDFKLDSAHPLGCSHHQKIVTIDDSFAVCGGIDMTSDRWDTPEHLDDDPRRKRPNGKPFGPWHDLTMLIEGPAAQALAELGRSRWKSAGGDAMEPCTPHETSAWPASLDAEHRDVEIGIARTRAEHGECSAVREIEHLFVAQIGRAKRFIYAENQYFASRKVAEAIARRMAEPDPPEIVIVTSEAADGWLEQKAMDGVRAQLVRSIGAQDRRGRFSIFHPVTAGGGPIYVHAKLLIIDDEIVRIGSANMNNRSLGLDSECDLFIDAARAGNEKISPVIEKIRATLLAEHCGALVGDVQNDIAAGQTMHQIIARRTGTNKRLLRLELPELSGADKVLAEQEVLDPESPDEMFEPFAKKSIFRRSRVLGEVPA